MNVIIFWREAPPPFSLTLRSNDGHQPPIGGRAKGGATGEKMPLLFGLERHSM